MGLIIFLAVKSVKIIFWGQWTSQAVASVLQPLVPPLSTRNLAFVEFTHAQQFSTLCVTTIVESVHKILVLSTLRAAKAETSVRIQAVPVEP